MQLFQCGKWRKLHFENNNSVFGQCIMRAMQTHSQLVQHPCRVVEGWGITQSWQDSKCGHGGINLVLQHIFWASFSFLSAGSGSAYRLTVYIPEIATVNDFPQEWCLAPCWIFAFYHNCYMLTCCASLTSRVFDSKRRSWWLMISFLLYTCSHCLTPPWLME